LNRQIDVIYIDSGGGHRAAASALSEVISQQHRPWDLHMLCIQELLDSIDFIQKATGIQFQELYNIMLRHGWTLGTQQLIPLMHQLIRMTHDDQVRVLCDYWHGHRPDLVVSLIPHYNRALWEALDSTWPGTPYVTVLTDIADYPPNFWIEPLDQYVICGSERAAEQAREIGLPESRILRTSGMILNPRFHRPVQVDRKAERLRLGLRPDLPTGLVLFGGEGSWEMVTIARELNRSDLDMQLILLCGRNDEVAERLRALESRIPMAVVEFTKEVPYHMALADFFIGKPGPGSISEALAMHLPVIVERNAWTLAHERYNADWVEERGFGLVVKNFRQVTGAVRELLEPERFEECKRRIEGVHNSALYEVPLLLEKILTS
jgi:UDP-N-acetylglucosamine:LPS N-acetylglucosamine transferase